jgi:hypothetical protein
MRGRFKKLAVLQKFVYFLWKFSQKHKNDLANFAKCFPAMEMFYDCRKNIREISFSNICDNGKGIFVETLVESR